MYVNVGKMLFIDGCHIYSHTLGILHDDVIKWKHFPRYWPLAREKPPVTGGFPSQKPVAWSFEVFFIWTNGWASNRDGGDLIRHRAHYGVTVILITSGPLRKKRKVVIDDALRHTTHVFMLKGICHNISILGKYLLKCVTPISANPECVIQQGRSLPLEYLENSIDIIHMI